MPRRLGSPLPPAKVLQSVIHVRMTDADYERVVVFCDARGITVSDLVRQGLEVAMRDAGEKEKRP